MPITCGDGPSDSQILQDFNKHGLQLGQTPQASVVFSQIRPAQQSIHAISGVALASACYRCLGGSFTSQWWCLVRHQGPKWTGMLQVVNVQAVESVFLRA